MTAEPEKSSNFFLGFLMLPREKREALSAVYAYCREIDDIVDSPDIPKEDARARLDFWRAEVGRLYEGKPTHEIALRLAPHVSRFGIPEAELREMIRGCAMDLEGTRYETIEDLESYMRGVAGSVGVMCARIFGWKHTGKDKIDEFAVTFGHAFQLTNILRDVGADLELGRVYLPDACLKEFGYSRERLLNREPSIQLDRALEKLHARAKGCYARARSLVDPRDRRLLLPAEVMAHVYERILDKLKDDGWPVLFEKTKLSKLEKLGAVVGAWRYCHGL